MENTTGKRVIITGASRGIGLETAKKFREAGWDVIGTSTKGDAKEDLDKLNLADSESITDFVRSIDTKVDLLINNAAVSLDFYHDKVETSILRKTLEINLIGTIDLTEQLLESSLIKAGGKIINVSSRAGSISNIHGSMMPTYKISKVGLNMYTRTLAHRLQSDSAKVYSFCPGWVSTDMGGSGAPKKPETAAQELYDLAISDLPSDKFYADGNQVQAW